MALRQKPINLPQAEERVIEAIIDKGGTVLTDRPKRTGKQKNYPLYFLQENMRQRVEAARRKRPGVKPPSANEWINQAILELLEREEA